MKKITCVYCGAKTYDGDTICCYCREKLKLIHWIKEWGTQMKLRAAEGKMRV